MVGSVHRARCRTCHVPSFRVPVRAPDQALVTTTNIPAGDHRPVNDYRPADPVPGRTDGDPRRTFARQTENATNGVSMMCSVRFLYSARVRRRPSAGHAASLRGAPATAMAPARAL